MKPSHPALYRTLFVIIVVLAAGAIAVSHPPAHLPSNAAQTAAAAAFPRGTQPLSPATKQRVANLLAGLPLSFEVNEGQTDSQVKFLARGRGYALFLTSRGATLSLQTPSSGGEARHPLPGAQPAMRAAFPGVPATAGGAPNSLKPRDTLLGQRAEDGEETANPDCLSTVRMGLAGANPAPVISGLEPLPGRSNYFLGNDPAKWRTNVATYARVKYSDVYPGVDLIYYGNQGQLEYDFVVAAGADPNAIALKLDAGNIGNTPERTGQPSEQAASLRIEPTGDLVVAVGDGEARFHKPVVYQEADGRRTEVPAGFALRGPDEVGFEVGAYDSTKALVIDPTLTYSTFLGGSGQDITANSMAVDSAGMVYITGYTASTNFPTTTGAFKTTAGGGNDAFVAKLDPSQTGAASLVSSTYIGGSADDFSRGIAVDGSGAAYITGYTYSPNFPVAGNAFQTYLYPSASYCGSGCADAFLTKITYGAGGASSLAYSSYIGAECTETGNAIAIGPNGDLYITGLTCSLNFPLTATAYSRSRCGLDDVVFWVMDITKPPAQQMVYATIIGGCTGQDEEGEGIAVDAAGNAYIAGVTYATDFPTTAGAFQRSSSAPIGGFVLKFNPFLSGAASLLYSTYLNGSANGFPIGVAVDAVGNAYVAGYTTSADFPTTPGAFQRTLAGTQNAFITKLNPTGSALVYSTFLGGATGPGVAIGIVLDSVGDAYVAGYTNSSDFPLVNPIQGASGGKADAFVSELNASGSGLVLSSYLGGSGNDFATSIAMDSSENLYLGGFTASPNFPTTPSAFDLTCGTDGTCNGGIYDAFVAKIQLTPPNSPPTANAGPNQTVEATSAAGANVTLDGSSSNDPDGDVLTYAWTGPFGTATGVKPVVLMPLGTNTVNLKVDDGHGNTATSSVQITVQDTTPPTTSILSHPNSITNSMSATFAFTGSDLVTPAASLTFQCSLDSGAFVPCTSPQNYTISGDGTHSFKVRAIDAANNTDPAGAFFMWTLVTAPPVLTLPANITTQATSPSGAAVSFSATANSAVLGSVAVTCNPPSASTFPIGTTTVNCSATDAAGNTANGSFMVTVTRLSQTISFTALPLHTYGDSDFAVSASASSGLGVSFTVGATDNCTISGSMVHITGAGSCTVTAHQAGNSTYLSAADVPQTFAISKALASVTPNASSKTYGTADPAFTGTLTGFLATDNVTATYSRTAGEMVAGSPYTISATLAPAGVLGNYNITYNTAAFTINRANASVTPNAASKTYGTADPTFTGTLSGFLPADSVTATYSRTAGEMVAGSPYTISATLAPAGVLGNYNITYNTASFTITQASASVTPNAASKTYGAADPTFTGTLTGFLPADNVTATYTRTAGETVAGSPYTISATLAPAGVLGNYNITYNTAPFTISAAALVATANSTSRLYGDPNPVFTGTLSGVASGDGIIASFSSAATPSNPVGNYPIVPTLSDPLGRLGNYNVTLNNGTLAIQPAPLTIMANSYPRPYGANNPPLMGTITGLKNGDPITANFVTTATPSSPVGAYAITPIVVDTMNLLANYAVSLVNGTLTVNIEPTTLTVTPLPASIDVGLSTQVTLTLTASDMVIPIDPGVLAALTLTSPVVSDILTNNGVCTPVPSASPGVASCIITLTSVEPNGRTLNGSFPGSADLGPSTGKADLTVSAALVTQQSCIKSDFRNVAVAGNSYLWFNSILRAHRDGEDPAKMTITFYQSSVQFQYTDSANQSVSVNQPLPDAKVTFDPAVTSPTTTFDAVNNVWITTLPYDTDDNAFLTGMPWLIPAAGLPADVEPVTMCGTFASDTANVDLSWRWTAAAYSSFSADNNALGVKPMDSDRDNWAPNHDKAGTPENFKTYVIPGARGKGGKNYTGTYSRDADIE